jgi:hypothetical protein
MPDNRELASFVEYENLCVRVINELQGFAVAADLAPEDCGTK